MDDPLIMFVAKILQMLQTEEVIGYNYPSIFHLVYRLEIAFHAGVALRIPSRLRPPARRAGRAGFRSRFVIAEPG
jgi:hypothetical protein